MKVGQLRGWDSGGPLKIGPKFTMRFRVTATAILALGLVMAGCANDRSINSGALNDTGEKTVFSYFPTNSGYTVSLVVTDANGVEIGEELFSATSATVVDGLSGLHWVGTSYFDSSVTTRGAIFWDENAIYHQVDGSSDAERILQEPLEYGASWPRWRSDALVFDSLSTGGNIFDDQNGNNEGLGLDDGSGGDNLFNSSSFPTKGSSTFYVAGTDDVIEAGGKVFVDCLQIVNAGDGQTVNRYWYAPGQGLIKYSLNCQFEELEGQINAVLR